MWQLIEGCDLEKLKGFSKEFAKQIKDGSLIFLKGDLGSGKTTLVKHLVENLAKGELVTSPTYAYVRKYGLNIYHFDLYRLEALDIELEELIFELKSDPKNIILIEWPEILKETGLKPNFTIEIEHLNEENRNLKVFNQS
jgi:tRNA threonylcarbamoyladenosine biosynthesis protein TsaE